MTEKDKSKKRRVVEDAAPSSKKPCRGRSAVENGAEGKNGATGVHAPASLGTCGISSSISDGNRTVGANIARVLEQNYIILNEIRQYMSLPKVHEYTELLGRLRDNLLTILNQMNSMTGVMGQMPALPVKLNLDGGNALGAKTGHPGGMVPPFMPMPPMGFPLAPPPGAPFPPIPFNAFFPMPLPGMMPAMPIPGMTPPPASMVNPQNIPQNGTASRPMLPNGGLMPAGGQFNPMAGLVAGNPQLGGLLLSQPLVGMAPPPAGMSLPQTMGPSVSNQMAQALQMNRAGNLGQLQEAMKGGKVGGMGMLGAMGAPGWLGNPPGMVANTSMGVSGVGMGIGGTANGNGGGGGGTVAGSGVSIQNDKSGVGGGARQSTA